MVIYEDYVFVCANHGIIKTVNGVMCGRLQERHKGCSITKYTHMGDVDPVQRKIVVESLENLLHALTEADSDE